MDRSIKIKCKQPCTVHFWSDDDLGDITSDELTSGDDETLKSDNKNKYYRFDESKKFNFFLNNVNTLKYKTSEEETEHEYKKPAKPVVLQKIPSSKPSNTKPINLVKSAFDSLQQPVAGDKCGRIFNFSNRGLTCYLDSLLFALFALQKMEDYIPRTFFNADKSPDLRTFLYNNYLRLTDPASIKKGKQFDMCELGPEYLFPHGGQNVMGHDGELLMIIFSRLDIEPVVYTHNKTYKMNQTIVNNKNISANKPPMIQLPYHKKTNWLQDENNFILETIYEFTEAESQANLLRITDQSGIEKLVAYNKEENIEKYNIKNIEFIVFENQGTNYIINAHLGKKKSRAEIILNENSVIPNIEGMVQRLNPRLRLNKITCKSGGAGGGHFICYFRCNTNWYVYNDMGGGTIKMLKTGLLIDSSFKWSLLFFDITNPTI